MYYLCAYGLYCALEEPAADVCCAYGPSESHTGSAKGDDDEEEDDVDDSLVSGVERSGVLLS